jgi:hypothetical protein
MNTSLDDRLRNALHDLDTRVHAHLGDRVEAGTDHGPAGTRPPGPPASDLAPGPRRGGPRRRGLVPVLAGLGVLALLITVGWTVRPQDPATTVRPSGSSRPSQSPADAARDQVLPEIAAMPLSRRLAPITADRAMVETQVTGPEGSWVISSPDISSIEGTCPNPSPSVRPNGGGSTQQITCVRYTEILLMTPDLGRIIKAFPIKGYAPQWVTLTPTAIYCGAQADARSMICRIDRISMAVTGRMFPNRKQSHLVDDYGTLTQDFPGTWTQQKVSDLTGFDHVTLDGPALKVTGRDGKPTITLDPVTLQPLP